MSLSFRTITRRQMVAVAGLFSARLASALVAPGTPGNGQRAADAGPAAGEAMRYPRTAAEIAAGVVPSDYGHPDGPGRYGALGNRVADDSRAWAAVGAVNGYHFAQDGFYLLRSRVQTSGYVTIVGSTRQSTWLISGFSTGDYLFEIGSRPQGPNPNVGALERLRFTGNRGNLACLHLQSGSHMWRLNDLLFSGGCPALIIDNCWDSNYTNLDILSAGISGGSDPALGASVIIRRGSNNLYFRGLRIEAPVSGGIYVDEAAAVRINGGKIDNGFGAGQGAASITVTSSGELHLDEFYLGGQYSYQASIAGGFICGNVTFDGGSGQPASIHDSRAWVHVDTAASPGVSRPNFRPAIPRLDLGRATFHCTHPSVNTTTPAAVYSKIFPIRMVDQLRVTANQPAGTGSTTVATDAHVAFNDQYTGCYLVYNATGMQSKSRRKILACFVGGQMAVAGAHALPSGPGWSIEYCGGHYTPITARDITLNNGATLFARLSIGVAIIGAPAYDASLVQPTFGMTKLKIAAPRLRKSEDLRGMYLIDATTGEPFLIGYGIDAGSYIGVMYDRSAMLDAAHVFIIQAGYAADIRRSGSSFEWTYAGQGRTCLIDAAANEGFDQDNMPLWGAGRAGGSVHD